MSWKLPGLSALATAFAVAVVLATPAGAVTPTAIYDNVPSPLPGNLPSVSYEANGVAEFGDRVAFSTGSPRIATTVDVVMSSWGCQAGHWTSGDCVTAPGATFTHPITLNLYAVGADNAPGAPLGSVTQTFAIPYRPSADLVNCTGASFGKWFDAASSTCFNGLATTITFDLTSLNLMLPDQVIFGIAYNTTDGYSPIGASACSTSPAGCGYDSLNVAVTDPATSLSAGSNPAPADAYQDTIYNSCSGAAIHPFGLDAGCWTGFKPAVRFNAAPPAVGPPTSKDQCKNDGWKTFNNPPFKNQGDCVSSVTSH
jgi:hypothetical protein